MGLVLLLITHVNSVEVALFLQTVFIPNTLFPDIVIHNLFMPYVNQRPLRFLKRVELVLSVHVEKL
jgi:hypothetical protein